MIAFKPGASARGVGLCPSGGLCVAANERLAPARDCNVPRSAEMISRDQPKSAEISRDQPRLATACLHERRLAHPVGAEDGDPGARLHGQRHLSQHGASPGTADARLVQPQQRGTARQRRPRPELEGECALKSAPRLHTRRRLGGVEPSAWIWGEVRKSVAPTALFMARFRWDTAKLCLVGICSESSASLSPSSSLRVR